MTHPGRLEIPVEADVTGFGKKLEAAVNKALQGVKLNLGPISKQIGDAAEKATNLAAKEFQGLAPKSQASLAKVRDTADRLRAQVRR